MESMDKVRLEYWNENWTISSESMENVHGFFPVCPWIFSMESMDFFSMESMDFVQGDSGQCPWKLSMENVHGNNLWTLSMESVEIIHGPFNSRLCSVDPDKSPES